MLKNKKKVLLIIAGLLVLILGIMYWYQSRPYSPSENEIALRIQMDVKEDIGLLVFDYEVEGHQYGGGVSNADGSLIKHDDQIINVWDRGDEGLEISSDTADMWIRFRIITESIAPNFENIYPEEITRYLEPLTFKIRFGEMYDITITGDRDNGYKAVLN